MDQFPVLRKLADWPTVVGFGLGILFIVFLVYPPHADWGGGLDWGDVGGWLGAIATFGATVVALWLAGREARERRQQRGAEARVLASLLAFEIKDASERATGLSALMVFRGNNENWRSDVAARSSEIQLQLTAARVERLPLFPPDLASNLASALALASRVGRVAQQISDASYLRQWRGKDEARVEQLASDVMSLMDFLAISVEACERLAYDGRMTPWHPDFVATMYGVPSGDPDDE